MPHQRLDLALSSDSDMPLVCNESCLRQKCPVDVFDPCSLEETTCCSKEDLLDTWKVLDDLFNQTGLHFVHINMRSLQHKLYEIKHLVVISKAAIVTMPDMAL